MRPKDQMCALIEWISQDVTDSGSAPEIIVGVKLRVGDVYKRQVLEVVSPRSIST